VRQLRPIVFVLCLVTLTANSVLAGGRPDKSRQKWFGQVAGGFSFAQSDFGDIVDDDLILSGGATYWPEDWKVGINLDASYDKRDISSSAIRAINQALQDIDPDLGTVTGGDVRTWGFSVNAVWGLGGHGKGLYLIGGVYPGGVGPGTFVRAKESTTDFAWNAGLGYTFELDSGSVIFVEARYKTVETDRESTVTVPLVVGFRW